MATISAEARRELMAAVAEEVSAEHRGGGMSRMLLN